MKQYDTGNKVLQCNKDWFFFENCAKPNVLFTKRFVTLIRIRQFGDQVQSPTTRSTSEWEEKKYVLDFAII